MKLFSSTVLALLLFSFVQCFWAYEVPRARFEVYGKGFDVSIPHEPGITLFAFHGNKNEPMDGLEAGQWSRDVNRKSGRRWTFSDENAELKKGDVIYYWTYVLKDGIGYREDDGVYRV